MKASAIYQNSHKNQKAKIFQFYMEIHLLIRMSHTLNKTGHLIRINRDMIELISQVHYKSYKKRYLIWLHKTSN